MINVEVMGFNIRHPQGGQKANTNLGQIQLEFKVSEDMLNYLTVMRWIYNIRYGELENPRSELIRLYACDYGTLTLMDNEKRTVANLRFSKLLPSNLSSLNLVTGAAEEITFSVSFTYEEIEYELKDPAIGGTNITAPTVISPCGVSATPLSATGVWSD
jgi:hypothetical protein